MPICRGLSLQCQSIAYESSARWTTAVPCWSASLVTFWTEFIRSSTLLPDWCSQWGVFNTSPALYWLPVPERMVPAFVSWCSAVLTAQFVVIRYICDLTRHLPTRNEDASISFKLCRPPSGLSSLYQPSLATPLKLYCVSRNVPPLTCYSLDIHDTITIIFGRSVTEKVRNQTMLCCPTSPV